MMMVLGLYVFMLRTVPYQELQYQRSWRHAANSRVNRRPSTQFLGPDNDMLTLSGGVEFYSKQNETYGKE